MRGIDTVYPTSIGTGTTETQLGGGNLSLPAWAKSIVAVRPHLHVDTPTEGEPVIAKLTLKSDDFHIQPYSVLCPPSDSVLGATANTLVGESGWYIVNCPVSGGSELGVYGQALASNTAAPYMSAEFIIADSREAGQRFAKVGTLTSTAAVGVAAAESEYTLTGGKILKEVCGCVVHTTLAAADAIAGTFSYMSNDMQRPTPISLITNSISGILGTAGGSLIPGIARAAVDIPIKSPCMFSNQLTLKIAPGTAGKFVTGVLYQ